MTLATQSSNANIDPAEIAAIVRSVLDRLRPSQEPTTAPQTPPPVVKLVTVETVETAAASSHKTILVSQKSIVTPAARDEAKRLGVSLLQGAAVTTSTKIPASPAGTSVLDTSLLSHSALLAVHDTTDSDWSQAVINHLSRRGVSAVTGSEATTQVVLTNEPARWSHHYSAESGKRAAMIVKLSQIERFSRELSPEVWVLDKTEMNLSLINNAVSVIARLSGGRS